MSFASHTTSLVPSSSPTRGGHVAALHIPATSCLGRSTAGVLPPERLQVTSCSSLLQCNAISRARTEGSLIRTVSQLSLDTLILAHGRDSHQQLYHGWQKWLSTWEEGDDMGDGNAELFIRTLNLSSRSLDESLFSHPKYKQLLEITSRVCGQLRLFQNRKVHCTNGCMTDLGGITTVQIESDMQELVKLALTKSLGDLDSRTKQTFLVIARSFYYTAFFNPGTINFHIAKVLFERA